MKMKIKNYHVCFYDYVFRQEVENTVKSYHESFVLLLHSFSSLFVSRDNVFLWHFDWLVTFTYM